MQLKTPKSLAKIYFYSLVILALLLTMLFSYIWIDKEFAAFNVEAEKIVQEYFKSQKNKIKGEVNTIVKYINFKKSQAEDRIRLDLKSRTEEALYIANHIYKTNKDKKSEVEIKQEIKNALHPANWDGGNGYYFSFDLNGNELINRNNISMVGKNLLGFKDVNGKYVVRDMLTLTKSQEEGYVSYYWDKPDNPGVEVKKISFIKLFKPYGWVIGTGKYVDDEEKLIKKEVLGRIESIRFENDRYYFIGEYSGYILTNPAKGKNLHDIEDVNGVKVVQELIKVSKSGGGYVEYVMPSMKGQKPLPKISYSMGVDSWKWFVGSGVYVHEIKQIILEKQTVMQGEIKTLLFKYLIIILVFISIIVSVAKLISNRIRRNLESFSDFFFRSSLDGEKINEEEISFSEFHKLASYANEMLDRKKRAEESEQRSLKQYSTIFESSRDALLLLDPETVSLLDCNPAAVAMYALKNKEQILKLTVYDLFPKCQYEGIPTSDKVAETLSGALEHGLSESEWKSKRMNGEVFYSYVITSRIEIDGKIIILVTVRDITESKKTQALIIQSEKMLSIGGLAAGMAHEINNPLAGMVQTVSILENRLLHIDDFPANVDIANKYNIKSSDLESYMHERGINRMISTIQESGKRIAQIVSNMLNFAGSTNAKKQHYIFADLIEKTLELASIDYSEKRKYDFKKIKIVKDYQDNLPNVYCEAGMIQQVLLNLFQNGAHEMFEAEVKDPTFNIKTWYEAEKQMVGIEIEDNGYGIDPAVKATIFEPFFTTKRAGVGTGLGLSVSYYIITEDHGGEITEESIIGHGAKFRILLPIDP